MWVPLSISHALVGGEEGLVESRVGCLEAALSWNIPISDALILAWYLLLLQSPRFKLTLHTHVWSHSAHHRVHATRHRVHSHASHGVHSGHTHHVGTSHASSPATHAPGAAAHPTTHHVTAVVKAVVLHTTHWVWLLKTSDHWGRLETPGAHWVLKVAVEAHVVIHTPTVVESTTTASEASTHVVVHAKVHVRVRREVSSRASLVVFAHRCILGERTEGVRERAGVCERMLSPRLSSCVDRLNLVFGGRCGLGCSEFDKCLSVVR